MLAFEEKVGREDKVNLKKNEERDRFRIISLIYGI